MKKVGPAMVPIGFVATEYEIVANVIRPAAGAEVTERALWREESGQDPPYIALFDAVGPAEGFDPGPERSRRLPPGTAEQILAWCRQFGLLGLLPHWLTAYAPVGSQPWVALPHGSWRFVSGPPWIESGMAFLGNALPPRMVSFTDREWFPHFPHVRWNQRGRYSYPPPDKPAFWEQYGEPVERFVDWAIQLRDALRTLASSMPGGPAKEPLTKDDAALILTSLLLSTKLEVEPAADAPPALTLGAPSLFGRLAYIATRDLTADWIRVCQLPECQRIFRSKSGAGYCSEKHYDVARKRDIRKSAKEKT